GCARMKVVCSSGVSLTMPDFMSAWSVAKMRPLARKSGCPMCSFSVAPPSPSAMRRKSFAFTASIRRQHDRTIARDHDRMLVMCRPAAVARSRRPAVAILTNARRPGTDDGLDGQDQPLGEDVTLPRVVLIGHRRRLMNRAADAVSREVAHDCQAARTHGGLDHTADLVDLPSRAGDRERRVKRVARTRPEPRRDIGPRS